MKKPNTTHLTRGLLALLAGLTLAACDAVPTESTVAPSGDTVIEYSGDPCATAEVCAFKVAFWDKMGSTSCDNCHDGNDKAPHFLHQGDVNTAYSQALTVVNLADPELSDIVTQIASGHNCGTAEACNALATIVEGYISDWAGGGAGGGGASNEIVLEAPAIKSAGQSKSWPASSAGFASTVWPLLTANCAGCHVESAGSNAQSPYFAESDVDTAYDAIRTSQKINLDDPASSRLVVRLREEFHNCWDPENTGSTNCDDSAQAMQTQIEAFANPIVPTSVDSSWVVSKALNIVEDGIVASGGARDDSSTIALYQFKSGSGNTVYDTSGVEPALNLTLSGNYRWVGGWGVEFINGEARGATAQSRKLRDNIAATGEYSIEAWLVPANINQGTAGDPSRIITYSGGNTSRNFTLGQAEYRYEFMNRNANSTDLNGSPSLLTDDMDEDLKATQHHVVVTYDAVDGRKVYVNGVDVSTVGNDAGSTDPATPGSLIDWSDNFAFLLGGETTGNDRWAGKLRLVAIHNRALTPEQIQQNFDAGVGEKFFLLFSVSEQMGGDCFLPAGDVDGAHQCFVYFTVSQFDDYSYLFTAPTFISLNPAFTPNNTVIKGVRIGLNGKEPAVGQAYRKLDTTINATDYTSAGQALSPIGTIIALENGTAADEFFLTFEQLGSFTNARVESVCNPITDCMATPTDGDPVSDIGLRTFEEIMASMATMTGIDPFLPQFAAVAETYYKVDTNGVVTGIKQQLPTVENINTFVSAQEIATAQLAIQYCDALVEDTSKRASFFPGFDFTAAATSAFNNQTKKDQIIDPLMASVMGTNLATQPDTDGLDDTDGVVDGVTVGVQVSTAVRPELGKLMVTLVASCGGSCDSERTKTIVKATCAALLGSAVSLVQ